MRERHFCDLARKRGPLGGPVAECRSEAVGGEVVASHTAQKHKKGNEETYDRQVQRLAPKFYAALTCVRNYPIGLATGCGAELAETSEPVCAIMDELALTIC
jgi:hypothetical protein